MAYPQVTIPVVELTAAEKARQRARAWTWAALAMVVLAAPVPFVARPHFPMIGIGGLALFSFGMMPVMMPFLFLGETVFMVAVLIVYAIFWFSPPVAALWASSTALRRTWSDERPWSRAAVALVLASAFLVMYVGVGYVCYQPMWWW